RPSPFLFFFAPRGGDGCGTWNGRVGGAAGAAVSSETTAPVISGEDIRLLPDRVLDRVQHVLGGLVTPVAFDSVLGEEGLDLVPGRGGQLRLRVLQEGLHRGVGLGGLALGPRRLRVGTGGDDAAL